MAEIQLCCWEQFVWIESHIVSCEVLVIVIGNVWIFFVVAITQKHNLLIFVLFKHFSDIITTTQPLYADHVPVINPNSMS